MVFQIQNSYSTANEKKVNHLFMGYTAAQGEKKSLEETAKPTYYAIGS